MRHSGAMRPGLLDSAMDRLVVPGFSGIGYAVRRRLPGWPADPPPGALAGRQIVVTGASSGLGEQVALDVVRLGGHVHLVIRDEARGAAAADRIAAATGRSEATSLWRCDVADLDDVRALAGRMAGIGPLAGLVHNAGSLPAQRSESAQGHELTMALHVLGPVLMTELLLAELRADGGAASGGHGARVVFVTSGGMYTQPLPVADPDYRVGKYAGATAYARSKRTQVELLPILQQRWGTKGLTVHATHPGWAATPGVSSSLPAFERLTRPILRDSAAGADTTTWLLAREPVPAGGRLWHDRAPRPTSMLARTRPSEADRHRIWQWVRSQCDLPA